MQELTKLLEQLEGLLDLDHCAAVERRHLDTMAYGEPDWPPLSVDYPLEEDIHPFPYAEAFNDPEKMLFNELAIGFGTGMNSVLHSTRVRDDYPLQVRSNHGIGITGSLFGCKVSISGNNMPWVHPLEFEEVKRVISRGVPTPGEGLTGQVYETCARYAELMAPYPKCSKAIKITLPDLQGPFDNLHLIRGTGIFTDLYDDPDFVAEALGVVTEGLAALRRYYEPVVNDKAGEKSRYIHRAIYSGDLLIKEDTETANISEDMFEEFCAPCNKRLFDEFGTGSVHFCGKGRDWHFRQMVKQNMCCLNFGNPEMQDLFGQAKALFEHKICIVGHGDGQPYSFVRGLMEQGATTGVTFMCTAKDEGDAKRILEEHQLWYTKNKQS